MNLPLDQIHIAFDGVRRPKELTLHVAEEHDNYDYDNDSEHRKKDFEGCWQDIPSEHLLRCIDGLSHLGADGLPFYLPAAMCWVLRHFQDTDSRLVDWTIYQLVPNRNDKNLSVRYDRRFSQFSSEQWRACEAFLDYLLDADPEGDIVDATSAREALCEVQAKKTGEQVAVANHLWRLSS